MGLLSDNAITELVQWAINKFSLSKHSHTKSEITDFPTIPTKTSQLENDSGYIKEDSGRQITIDSELSETSENPVQNKAVATALKNVNAETVDGKHADDFFEKLLIVALNDGFSQERTVNDTDGKALYREYIRKTADGKMVNKYYRVYSPDGVSYTDLKVNTNADVATWVIAGSGYTGVNLIVGDKPVLTAANKHYYESAQALGWTDNAQGASKIPTLNAIAFWNGAYSGEASNLSYCKLGAFGTMATQDKSEYAKIICGTYTGTGKTQTINIGATPKAVFVECDKSEASLPDMGAVFAHEGATFSASTGTTALLSIATNGFTLNNSMLSSTGKTYLYVALV